MATTSDGDDMDDDDHLFDMAPLAPVDLPAFEEFEPPAPAPRWSPPATAVRPPPYGLVGVPSSTVTTKDAKVAAIGFGLGALLVGLISWFGSRRGA